MSNASDRPEPGDRSSEPDRTAAQAEPAQAGEGATPAEGPSEAAEQPEEASADGPSGADRTTGQEAGSADGSSDVPGSAEQAGSGEGGAKGASLDKAPGADRATGQADGSSDVAGSAAQVEPGAAVPAAASDSEPPEPQAGDRPAGPKDVPGADEVATETRPTPPGPTVEPGYGQPGYAQPGYGHEASGQPGYIHPGYGHEQGYGRPGYDVPGHGQPGYYGPAGQGANYGTGHDAAPRPGIVPLRPLRTGEVLAGAIGYIRANPLLTLGVSAAVMTVTVLIQLIVLFALPQVDPTAVAAGRGGGLGAQALGQFLSSLIGIALGALLTGLLLVVLSRAVLGQRIAPVPAWEAVAPRLAGLVGLTLLIGLVVGGIVLVSGLPIIVAAATGSGGGVAAGVVLVMGAFALAIYLGVLWALAPAAYVLESIGVLGALRRSAGLVRGAWWRTLGVLVLAGFLVVVPSVILLGLAGGFSLDPASTPGAEIGPVIAMGVAGTFTTPFSTGVIGLLYIDQRIRRERFDEELALHIGG